MSGAKKPMNHRREAKYSILRIKLSGSTPTRFLWVKPHVDGSDHADGTTTIFMAGLPIALSASRLENALLPLFGPVERCVVHRAKTSAIAVFQDAKAVVKLLKFAASKRVVAVPEEEEEGASYGLKSWVEAHKAERPGQARLQEQLDGWTEAFEMEEENIRREREALMEEDGWTVVKTHKGRKKNRDAGSGTTVGAVTAGAALALKAKAAKKDKESLSTDFYRFQRREKKRNELLDLRKKFEEDKKRLAELKSSRKFKPLGSKFADDAS